MMTIQDVINDVVTKTCKLQDTSTRAELAKHLQSILESPKFKAMSALDVVQLMLAKLREGHDEQA